jgi:hypothetical protein
VAVTEGCLGMQVPLDHCWIASWKGVWEVEATRCWRWGPFKHLHLFFNDNFWLTFLFRARSKQERASGWDKWYGQERKRYNFK